MAVSVSRSAVVLLPVALAKNNFENKKPLLIVNAGHPTGHLNLIHLRYGRIKSVMKKIPVLLAVG